MKKNHVVKITENSKIGTNVYKMTFSCLEVSDKIKPGQFISIKINNDNSKILRRPISISDINNGNITVIYEIRGSGTKILSNLKKGDKLDFLGPLGNSFPIYKNKKTAVIGGGIGIFPLYYLIKKLNDYSNVDTYMGFRDKSCVLLKDEYSDISENFCLSTDDGSMGYKGFIIDYFYKNIDNYDVVYACGPSIMLKKLKEMCVEKNIELYVSLEERMGCGIGACLVCACEVMINNGNETTYKHVCKDGPVFDAYELIF